MAEVASSPSNVPPVAVPRERNFHLFAYLSEDLKMTVLSFLAEAPFEALPANYSTSTLTHQLPVVSQTFRRLAAADLYWKDAVVRQIKNEPFLWKPALCQIRRNRVDGDVSHGDEEKESTPEEFVEDAYSNIEATSYKMLYQRIVTHKLRYKGPVFAMEGQVCLGEPYGLHFFEPRYRLMIAELMRGYPEEARSGGRIPNPPVFVHANRGPLAATTPATLVEVVRCEIFPDGRADVTLMPKAYTWIEKIWEEPDMCGLHFVQCLRMGEATTHSMNQLARQEALTFMMSRLLGNLRELEGELDNPVSSGSGTSSSGYSGSSTDASDR